jgi:predicted ABC-type ATPase
MVKPRSQPLITVSAGPKATAVGRPSRQLRLSGKFDTGKHPRGQPKNKGQFAKKGGGTSVPTAATKTPAKAATPAPDPPKQPLSIPAGELPGAKPTPHFENKAAATGKPVHQTPTVERIEKEYPPANPDGIDTNDRHQVNGVFSPQRQALHRKIAAKIRGSVPPSQHKTYMMSGGGPASGKSSIFKAGLAKLPDHHVLLDSDAIKAELPEYAPLIHDKDDRAADFVHEESSHLAKAIQKESLAAGQDVVLDGTGNNSLDTVEKKVNQARAAGYKVNAEYCTCSVDEAIRRNLERAKKTGRLPPEGMLRHVHKGVSVVLPQAVEKGLFDNARLWDTENHTGGKPTLVMSAQGNKMTVHRPDLWQKFLEKAK